MVYYGPEPLVNKSLTVFCLVLILTYTIIVIAIISKQSLCNMKDIMVIGCQHCIDSHVTKCNSNNLTYDLSVSIVWGPRDQYKWLAAN